LPAHAVVGQLEAKLMLPGGNRGLAADRVAGKTDEVVAVVRHAVLEVEAPAGVRAALGDDHPIRTAFRDYEGGGDGR
jgi:hypothetical protein